MNQLILERLLIVQLTDYINARYTDIGLPCPVCIEYAETTGEQLSIHALTGGVIAKRYVDGGFVGNFPFAVRYQLSAGMINNAFAKLDVPLWALGGYLEGSKIILPEAQVNQTTMTGLPYALIRDKDGVSVNQAIFKLEYYKNGGIFNG